MDDQGILSDVQDDQQVDDNIWQDQPESDGHISPAHSDTSGDSDEMEQIIPSDDPGSSSDWDVSDSGEGTELESDPASETEEGEPSDSSSDAGDPVSEDDQPEGPQSQDSARGNDDPKVRRAKARGDEWLYDGCMFTVLMAVYALVRVKLETNMTTVSFEAILRIFACLLPKDNQLPTSFFRCKSILMVKDLANFLWDCCPCGRWSWDPVDPKHEDDHCPFCKSRRYHPRVGNGKLKPVQVCFLMLTWHVFLHCQHMPRDL